MICALFLKFVGKNRVIKIPYFGDGFREISLIFNIQYWQLCFGGVTMGETQDVGPVTFSMISSSSSFCNWKGTLRCGWHVGCMSEFKCSVTWKSFSLPMPSNSSGWLFTSLSATVRFTEEGLIECIILINPNSSAVWRSSSALPSENIVPSMYTVIRVLCLVWPCYLYTLWLYKSQHINRKMLALFCHLLGEVC